MKVINEQYNPNKLYDRKLLVQRLKSAPRDIRMLIPDLPFIPCLDKDDNERICTKIPEVIDIYLKGRR
jgi:hypothetical protein